jgi:hypothetical protein
VAGIEAANGALAWIRPVSARERGELSEAERRFQDGSDPRLLDIVGIPVHRHEPNAYQSENWVIDYRFYWNKVGEGTAEMLPGLVDHRDLWLAGSTSTWHGTNDQLSLALALTCADSLRFLSVSDLRYRVFAPRKDFGEPKRRVMAEFTHLGAEYGLWVTDPLVERQLLAQDDGEYHVGNAYLTVSLGEPYDGFVYKLVAAVFKG